MHRAILSADFKRNGMTFSEPDAFFTRIMETMDSARKAIRKNTIVLVTLNIIHPQLENLHTVVSYAEILGGIRATRFPAVPYYLILPFPLGTGK